MSDGLTDWIAQLFGCRELLLMGHAQRQADLNLGLGWLYYALARMIRPSKAVVIGSYRGFVPLVIARAMADNSEGGVVHFIDPSLVDDFWTVESDVQNHFASHGVTNIRHWLMTTQEFVATEAYRQLDQIGIAFIDGYHTAEQARFDFEAFANKLMPSGMALLHDSVWRKKSRMYGPGREYEHSVVDFLTELKQQSEWQVLDLPFGDGVTIVRRAAIPDGPSPTSAPCEAGRLRRGSLAATGASSIRRGEAAINQGSLG
jgi:predicted O-methyltransferase YrrM